MGTWMESCSGAMGMRETQGAIERCWGLPVLKGTEDPPEIGTRKERGWRLREMEGRAVEVGFLV